MTTKSITWDDWNTLVEENNKPVLVEFMSPTFPVCEVMEHIIEDISKEYDNKISVYQVNIHQEERLFLRYGVNSVPTFKLFCKGKSVG